MVAMIEIAILIVCVVLGLWWLSRTNLYRARRRAGAESGGAARESLTKHNTYKDGQTGGQYG